MRSALVKRGTRTREGKQIKQNGVAKTVKRRSKFKSHMHCMRTRRYRSIAAALAVTFVFHLSTASRLMHISNSTLMNESSKDERQKGALILHSGTSIADALGNEPWESMLHIGSK